MKAGLDSDAGKLPSQGLLEAMGKYNVERVEAGIMHAGEGQAGLGLGRLQGHAYIAHPAQQDSCFTSWVKVWAQSLRPSTMVR